MALERRTVLVGLPHIEERGCVTVFYRDEVVDGEAVLASTERRELLLPGQGVSEHDEAVQGFCADAWTPEVVAAWQALVDEVSARGRAEAAARGIPV